MVRSVENQSTDFLQRMQRQYAPEAAEQPLFQQRRQVWGGMTPEQYQQARDEAHQQLGKLYAEKNKSVPERPTGWVKTP